MLIILAVTQTTITMTTMEIHDLTNNPGLLALQTGQARVVKGHHRFIHIIDLNNYKTSLEFIRNSIQNIMKFQNYDLAELLNHIILKFEHLQSTFDSIYPRLTKRGLVNIFGTGIKFITGNMDHNDAVRINKQIETLKANNNKLFTQNNEQIQINEMMINRFKNITHVRKHFLYMLTCLFMLHKINI